MTKRSEGWWRERAERERGHLISAGPERTVPPFEPSDLQAHHLEGRPESSIAFGKLVELMRRSRGWSVERLASEADLDLADVVVLEDDHSVVPEPRAVYKLAEVFQLPQKRLMQVAGLSKEKDPALQTGTLRFAARAQSIAQLSEVEQNALNEFVTVIASEA
jgi:HTH-type transcriptional regulator, competence development regulator